MIPVSLERSIRLRQRLASVLLVLGVALALLTPGKSEAAQGVLRWNTRSTFGIANCDDIPWGQECIKELAPELCVSKMLNFCKSITGWVPAALPTDGYGHFILNDVPLPTGQSPNAGYAYDPILIGLAIFKQGTNQFDANFDTSLLRIGSNRVRFDYGSALRRSNTYDQFSLVSSSGTRKLLAVSHAIDGRVWELFNLEVVNSGHWCLDYPAPFANYCSIYAGKVEIGNELDIDNLSTSFNLSVDEANPGFTKALEALNAAITEAEVSLIDNAKNLEDLAGQLQKLEQLREDVDDLVSKGLDQITAADMEALLANYPSLPADVRDALVQLVKDLKRSVQELRDELKRINAEFDRQVRGVVDLVNQNIASSGFNPNNPAGYRFGGGSVPTITLPAVTTDFDSAHDPYKAYAEKILAQMNALVVNGQVSDRAAFSGLVRIWEGNQKALSRALLQNSVSQAEFGAFQAARQTVTEFLRKFLDDQGWFLDNPVPIHVRSLFDGTYARILGDQSIQLKDALNIWNGSELSSPQDVLLDMVQGLASGMVEAEAELASAGELLTRLEQLNAELSRVAAHLVIGFTPGANDFLDFCEVTTGREFCTPEGRELTREERIYSAAGLGIGSGAFWRGVGTALTVTVGVIVEDLVPILKNSKLLAHLRVTHIHEYRGVRAAFGALEGEFEGTAAVYLTSKGRTHFLGGEGVKTTLQLGEGFKHCDFVNITSDGRLALSEVKASFVGQVETDKAIKQLTDTADAVKTHIPNADIAIMELIVPKGAKIGGDYRLSGDQIFDIKENKLVKVHGILVKWIEVS